MTHLGSEFSRLYSAMRNESRTEAKHVVTVVTVVMRQYGEMHRGDYVQTSIYRTGSLTECIQERETCRFDEQRR